MEILKSFTFYNFDSGPRFPLSLLYVRWKSGVTFVRRRFRDVIFYNLVMVFPDTSLEIFSFPAKSHGELLCHLSSYEEASNIKFNQKTNMASFRQSHFESNFEAFGAQSCHYQIT